MGFVSTLFILVVWCLGLVSAQIVFKTLTTVTRLYELQATKTTLTDVACEDTVDKTAKFKVSVGTVNPTCASCFQAYSNCGGGVGGSYCLEFWPVQTLSYALTREYTIQLICTNEADSTKTATATTEVRLYPNTKPFFSTAPSVSATLSNTENVNAGGSVYAVVCSDNDNDAIQYTLATTPPSNLFYIDTSGIIRASNSLKFACFSSITFSVTCSDRRNTPPTGPVYIHLALNGANQQPRVTGMNFNRDVPESDPIGTVLANYEVVDDNTPKCLLFTSPPESQQYFNLDTISKSVKVKTKLDYEQIATRNTNITVTCTDDYCTSPPSYLYIRVTDVNEQIQLVPNDFTVSAYEGNIEINPKWTPVDPDFNDDPTYTIVGGNSKGRFTINPKTGIITSTIEYDVDQSAMPPTDFLIVKATDKGGLTSTSTVTINILDINDNRPIFTVGSQTIVLSACNSLQGTNIGTTVSATDRDSALDGNNVVYYSGAGGPITVDSSGSIVVTQALTAPSRHTVSVTASDSGTGPKGALTASPAATITVVVTECITTTLASTVTTPVAPVTPAPTGSAGSRVTTVRTNVRIRISVTGANTKDNLDENLGWIVFAGLLATVLLAALAYMIWRYCYNSAAGAMFCGRCNAFCNNACGDCCTPRPPPRAVMPPKRGPQPPPGNKGFWQERYPDDDYIEQPDRNRTPTPAVMDGSRPLALEPTTNWRGGRQPPGFYM